ncbi:MAG: hypothetical protein ACN6OP_10185 [Pseudomonadales bacterium]
MSSVQWLAHNLSLPLDGVHSLLEHTEDPDKAAANLVESLSSTEFLAMLRCRHARLDHSIGEGATILDVLLVIAGESVTNQKAKLRFVIRQLQEVRH